MNKIKRIGLMLLCICMIATCFPKEVFAASASVKVSSGSGNVGSTVTVTCTASMSGTDIGGADVTLQYDPAALTVTSCSSGANGGSGSVYYSAVASNAGQSSLSFTVTFSVVKEGAHNVSVTYADVYDWDSAESVSTSTSGGKVTGVAETTPEEPEENKPEEKPEENKPQENKPEENKPQDNKPEDDNQQEEQPDESEKDKNSKLSSLQVYPGTLRPGFSAGTTSYTVEVDSSVTSVTITATAASDKAKVNVSGGKDLQPGDNAAKVIVTAENGSTTVYKLNIICSDVEEEKIYIGDNVYTIEESFTEGAVPAGFTKGEITYNGRQYMGALNENGTMVLMCLKGTEKSEFFLYDQETQSFSELIPVQVTEEKTIYLVSVDESAAEFAGYELTSVMVGDSEITAWKLDEEFSVVCAREVSGEKAWYRYDSVDGTYQRYVEIKEVEVVEPEVEDPVEVPEEEPTFLEKNYIYIIAGLGLICLILLVVTIVLAATRKTRRRRSTEHPEVEEIKIVDYFEDDDIEELINFDEE